VSRFGQSRSRSDATAGSDLKISNCGGYRKGARSRPSPGEEAAEEARPVPHPLEPGLDQGGELGEVTFGQLGQGSFQVRRERSTGLSSCAYAGAERRSTSFVLALAPRALHVDPATAPALTGSYPES
jgi:hypothetical protein